MNLARWTAVFVVVLLVSRAGPLANPVHIRVLLDTSASMGLDSADPDHLAKLAIMALGDLLDPATDSLEVLTFDPAWKAPCDQDPNLLSNPSAGGVPIRWDLSNPAISKSELRLVRYDGSCSFFSPGIRTLLNTFGKARSPAGGETRLLIVITDNMPSLHSEEDKHLKLLAKDAAALGVRTYWLLFPHAANLKSIAESFSNSGGGEPVLVKGIEELFTQLIGYVMANEAGWLSLQTGPLPSGREHDLPIQPGVRDAQVLFLAKEALQASHFEVRTSTPGGGLKEYKPSQCGAGRCFEMAAVEGERNRGTTAGYLRIRLDNSGQSQWKIRQKVPGRGIGIEQGLVLLNLEVGADLKFMDPSLGTSAGRPVGETVCFEANAYAVLAGGNRARLTGQTPYAFSLQLVDDANPGSEVEMIPMTNNGVSPDRDGTDDIWTACITLEPSHAGRRLRSRVLVTYLGIQKGTRIGTGPLLYALPEFAVEFSPRSISLKVPPWDSRPVCGTVNISKGGSRLPQDPVDSRIQVWEGANLASIRDPQTALTAATLPPPLDKGDITFGSGVPPGSLVNQVLVEKLSAANLGQAYRFCVHPRRMHAGGKFDFLVSLTPTDADYLSSWKYEAYFQVSVDFEDPRGDDWILWAIGTLVLLVLLGLLFYRYVRQFHERLAVEVRQGSSWEFPAQARFRLHRFPTFGDRILGYMRLHLKRTGVSAFSIRKKHGYLGRLKAQQNFMFRPAFKAVDRQTEVQHRPNEWFVPQIDHDYEIQSPEGSVFIRFTYLKNGGDEL